ncbi:unnamed protein product [Thlaspi arvense]|uniref:Pentatricopeptide repeat-containing protein n=1 Tax=Thlaspi arvense TaxID=13288 RepID=A0AAU9RM63_THLAR|nr:unnamed protein product [Thlaspi arvense]
MVRGLMKFPRIATKLLNISVDSLCKFRNLEKAESLIIDGIRLGVLPDVVTYNTLINGYSRFVGIDKAYAVTLRMREAGIKPNVSTYNSLISGAAKQLSLSRVHQLFDEMLQSGLSPDMWSYNTLMSCYLKLGKHEEAFRILHEDVHLSGLSPGVDTFNILLDAHCKSGHMDNAIAHFNDLKTRVKPDLMTYNILINGLCKSGKVYSANRMLRELEKSGYTPNAVTYTTMLKLYIRSKMIAEGLELFLKMKKEGYTFDGYANCAVSSALVKTGRAEEAHECMRELVGSGTRSQDIVCYNALLSLHFKDGNLDAVDDLLEKIEVKGLKPDDYTHTIIVNGLLSIGHTRRAEKHLACIGEMGMQPSVVTCNCLIHGLCKAGHVDRAMRLFESMKIRDEYTYTSVVHNLCKDGRLVCASKLLLRCYNEGMKIPSSARRAVLSGLRMTVSYQAARKMHNKFKAAIECNARMYP